MAAWMDCAVQGRGRAATPGGAMPADLSLPRALTLEVSSGMSRSFIESENVPNPVNTSAAAGGLQSRASSRGNTGGRGSSRTFRPPGSVRMLALSLLSMNPTLLMPGTGLSTTTFTGSDAPVRAMAALLRALPARSGRPAEPPPLCRRARPTAAHLVTS